MTLKHSSQDAENLMKFAFTDYDTVRPHSSIDFLPPEEFEKRWYNDEKFSKEFMQNRKIKEERRVKNRIEKKRRLKENVSLEDRKPSKINEGRTL